MGTSPGLGPGPQGIARSSRVTPTNKNNFQGYSL